MRGSSCPWVGVFLYPCWSITVRHVKNLVSFSHVTCMTSICLCRQFQSFECFLVVLFFGSGILFVARRWTFSVMRIFYLLIWPLLLVGSSQGHTSWCIYGQGYVCFLIWSSICIYCGWILKAIHWISVGVCPAATDRCHFHFLLLCIFWRHLQTRTIVHKMCIAFR